MHLGALPYRSLQVGLSGEAVDRYVNEWTIALTDVTTTVQTIHDLLRAGDEQAAALLLPTELPYPLPAQTAAIIDLCHRELGTPAQPCIREVKVGLRPFRRGGVRLEVEGRVIHNYGHGGSGFTVSWGCAEEVAALVTSSRRA